MLADQRTDRVELRSQDLRPDDRVAMHEVDVVVGRHVLGQVGIDEFAQPVLEEQPTGQEVLCRGKRGVRPVDVAQVDLALVPPAGGRHRRGLAVEDGHVESAAGELDRDRAAHDPGTEDRDPASAHEAASSAPRSSSAYSAESYGPSAKTMSVESAPT